MKKGNSASLRAQRSNPYDGKSDTSVMDCRVGLQPPRNDIKLILGCVLLLTACTSPTFQMSQAQVASLSDDQLCKYKNNYRDETKLEAEIAKRRINCDRFFRQCLSQGNQPGTQAMNFCIATLRENERLRYDNDRPWGGSGIGIYNTFPLRHHR